MSLSTVPLTGTGAQLAYHKADTVLLKADIQNWQAELPIGGWGGVGQGKQAANILDYLSN